MIKKAVFSYFNPDESFGNRCGFTRYSDFLFTTALSILCASRIFKEVQFISSDWGVDIVKKLDMPVTDYSNKLNEMKSVSRYFWAYGKLIAYNEQKEPFVHVDNDVFMWEPLPDRVLKAKLCFQSHEPFDELGYKYYNMLKPCFNKAKVKPKLVAENEVTDFAYNCGICGGYYLDFFKEWQKLSAEYIFAPENQDLFFKKFKDVLIHQNLFHEQYFAASMIKHYNLRKDVRVLADNAIKIPQILKYTHLWGTTKRDKGMMARVRMRLFNEDRELFMRVDDFCKSNNI